jgi:hypothetical protein
VTSLTLTVSPQTGGEGISEFPRSVSGTPSQGNILTFG